MPFPSRRGLLTLAAAVTSLLPRLSGAVNMQMSPLKNGVAGTWRMVDATARDPDGKPLPKPYGPQGMGLLTLNGDGRMMAVLCDGRKTLPDGSARDYSSYCGNSTFDGHTLVTRVDASGSPRNAIGSDQVREVRFDGKRMVFVPLPAMVDGVMQHREIHWERISALPA
jgi:hypothetical protein